MNLFHVGVTGPCAEVLVDVMNEWLECTEVMIVDQMENSFGLLTTVSSETVIDIVLHDDSRNALESANALDTANAPEKRMARDAHFVTFRMSDEKSIQEAVQRFDTMRHDKKVFLLGDVGDTDATNWQAPPAILENYKYFSISLCNQYVEEYKSLVKKVLDTNSVKFV